MKYKLGEKHQGLHLYRIIALKDFGDVRRGDVGGWVEGEHNLSQKDDCWVYGDARVYDNAKVYNNARVYNSAKVYGDAQVCGNAEVFGNAQVFGNASVFSNADVSGNAEVFGNAQVFGNARVSDNAWVSGEALVSDNAQVSGNAEVSGNARVSGNAQVSGDAQVYGIKRSDGYAFCYVPDKGGTMRVIAGCRYFTIEEAREHWTRTRGGTALGDETLAILECLEKLSKVKPEGCV